MGARGGGEGGGLQGQNGLLVLVAPLAWVNLGLVKHLQHLSQYWRLKDTIPGLWDVSPLSKQRSEHYFWDAHRRWEAVVMKDSASF